MPNYSRVVESEGIDLEFGSDDDDGDDSDDEQEMFPSSHSLFEQRLETRYQRRYPGAFRKVKRTIRRLAYLQLVLGAGLLALWKVADWKYFWHPYFRNKHLGLSVLSSVFFAGAALTAASVVGLYVSARWNSWVRRLNSRGKNSDKLLDTCVLGSSVRWHLALTRLAWVTGLYCLAGTLLCLADFQSKFIPCVHLLTCILSLAYILMHV